MKTSLNPMIAVSLEIIKLIIIYVMAIKEYLKDVSELFIRKR